MSISLLLSQTRVADVARWLSPMNCGRTLDAQLGKWSAPSIMYPFFRSVRFRTAFKV